ncbi:hypothetical protein ACHWQZ_G004450 [Mnemiopsis leidyi]
MFQTAPPSKELLGTAGTVPQLPLPHPGEITQHDESYHVVRATLFHHNTMPPLLQPHNQTLNTPFKEQRFKTNPSERIGNCYSPDAQKLSISKRSGVEIKRCKTSQKKDCGNQPPVLDMIPDGYAVHFTPSQQFINLENARKKDQANFLQPSANDVKRYNWYLENAFDLEALPKLPQDIIDNFRIKCGRPITFSENDDFEFMNEVRWLYNASMRQSTIDYILLDPQERSRLGIEVQNKPFQPRVIEGPSPWNQNTLKCHHWLYQNLFSISPVMLKINELWYDKYKDLRPFNLENLVASNQPALSPEDLKDTIAKMSAEFRREHLLEGYIADCRKIVMANLDYWEELLPHHYRGTTTSSHSSEYIVKFFDTIAALMSRHLCGMLYTFFKEIAEFLSRYENGNVYVNNAGQGGVAGFPSGEEKWSNPLVKVEVDIVDGQILFNPPLETVYPVLETFVDDIMDIIAQIPCLQKSIFPNNRSNAKLKSINRMNYYYIELVMRMQLVIEHNFDGPFKLIQVFDDLLKFVDGKEERVVQQVVQDSYCLVSFEEKILSLRETRMKIARMPESVNLNLIHLDLTPAQKRLSDGVNDLMATITDYVLHGNRLYQKEICRSFDEISETVLLPTQTTQELIELNQYVQKTEEVVFKELETKLLEAEKNVLFLLEYSDLNEEDFKLHSITFGWPARIKPIIQLSRNRLSHKKDLANTELRERIKLFEQHVTKWSIVAEDIKELDFSNNKAIEDIDRNVEQFSNLHSDLDGGRNELDEIRKEQSLLGREPLNGQALEGIFIDIEPFETFWGVAAQAMKKMEVWMFGPFLKLNYVTLEEELNELYRATFKVVKMFHDNPVPKRCAENILNRLTKFKDHLRLLSVICNPGMVNRHWLQIADLFQGDQEFVIDTASSLSVMIDMKLNDKIERLEEISTAATKEHTLETNLSKMQEEWKEMVFTFLPYRDTGTYIISALDEIQTLLDDHIVKTQTMKGSPFIKPLEAECNHWEKTLITVQDIIDEALKCQATWLYLEPIFSSEDIMQQMPREGRSFCLVDKNWKQIMAKAVIDPRVLTVTKIEKVVDDLKHNNNLLEDILKGLNNYLEVKRLYFARFFFLSNDELLEILSETKDPTRVQPHMKKCFEGIAKLEFDEQRIITGMISSESELVRLSKVINPHLAKGCVEKWLLEVENGMKQCLKDIGEKAIKAYSKTVREQWVLDWPGQIVLSGSQTHWTAEVSAAISEGKVGEYLEKCNGQINLIVAMVRGKLPAMSRITLGALIVIDVHARDVVESFHKNQVSCVTDFQWISQLRYYLEGSDLNVRMITTTIVYGNEYLGNSPRLVITPLTDRCYRTLMGAIKLTLGGAPEGPAGTGKTETSKDLAKAVAKQCVVFNCSDGLDYKAMGKFFKGLAQAGAWACFDEFNRIELEVLSVVAQQIQCIQLAICSKLKVFVFEGTNLTLDPTCTMFITMNPGYAGRSELPDNLKVLFRTVAMMVPDYGLIGEIVLYSVGFVQARALSTKIVATYKLCSEQLSSQKHYDYGMRAVKSVLTAAGNLKLQYPDEDEAILLLRAIRDVNLPKFLAQDLPLFQGIIGDLFPGVTLPEPDYNVLNSALFAVMDRMNLKNTEFFHSKIIQIYEMMLVRHGFMVVGATLGGKTSTLKVLAGALEELHKNGQMEENKVGIHIINPKSISMFQLYGNFDPVSHEWTDGVLPILYREQASSTLPDRQWLIFDGPIDAVWIENMNTVLDDNKKLCLMSGEIIQMSSKQSMIFETADLEQASPATVSRCGMVYMEPAELGWEPVLSSYLTDLQGTFSDEELKTIRAVFEWLLPPCLKMATRKLTMFVPLSMMHLARQTMTLYKLVTTTLMEEKSKLFKDWSATALIFSVLWSIGGCLPLDSRIRFSEMLRNFCLDKETRPDAIKIDKNNIYPEKGTGFDYQFLVENKTAWRPWHDGSKFSIPEDCSNVSSVIIPTKETQIIRYFLDLFVKHSQPLLVVGPTGTGKSAVSVNYLLGLDEKKYSSNIINFSAQTTSQLTQEMIVSKLDKRRKGVIGPAVGKQTVVFVDDLNMPMKQTYGAQPPIELLRQQQDQGHWYHPQDSSKLYLEDVILLAAMGPPGGSRNDITARCTRHFNVISVDSFGEDIFAIIFGTIVDWHFSKGFASNCLVTGQLTVPATAKLFRGILPKFLPIPSKSHYLFNLRDFARVIGGILLLPAGQCSGPDVLIRLWLHEVYRVFYDRLTDNEDRECFFGMCSDVISTVFKKDINSILAHCCEPGSNTVIDDDVRKVIFGNYSNPSGNKVYSEIQDLDTLQETIEGYLDEYNQMSKTPMTFVPFRYAIEHVSKVARVLLQPNGHVLLAGIGGSGRSSVAKLATHVGDYQLFQIEISKNYTVQDWRGDLRSLLFKAGAAGEPTTFLFNDNQIKFDSMLEDINMLLNGADIPNLYPADEKAIVIEKIQAWVTKNNIQVDSAPAKLYDLFQKRIRDNLHLVLVFSSIGDDFRTRLRKFPSLINCCTIDWFQPWPSDALQMVADRFLGDLDLTDEERSQLRIMCQYFQTSVFEYSEKFYEELHRNNYVTPTSYLELILTFKGLLGVKRDEISTLQQRYATGLEKLDFAASQVSIMKQEIIDLQPELIKSSKETEELQVLVEADAMKANAKRELVAKDEAVANEAAAVAGAIKADCEADLAEALPALEAAISALDTLKPSDISQVKALKNPPAIIKLVMEAVCIMKAIKPERKPDPSGSGKMVEDYWGPSQKLLGDLGFLNSLKAYDKDNIDAAVIKKIRDKYMNNPDFVPDKVKAASKACEGLCTWVLAMEVYERVIKVVKPKQAKLAEAEAELAVQMEKLAGKQAELKEVEDALKILNDQLDEVVGKKKKLEDNLELCEKKLERAEQLIGGLGGEKSRWTDVCEELKELYKQVTGNVLVASGIVAYFGPFTVQYRDNLLKDWCDRCQEENIRVSDDVTLNSVLGNPIQIRSWMLAGLPADGFSIDNAIIFAKSRRWPLMIDPQGQANKWIKNMEKSNKLVVMKMNNANFIRSLENAVQFGTPLLLENVGEELDPVLEPLLLKQVYKQGGVEYLRIGDATVEFSREFRFFITTRLRNPHYLPEVSVKVTLLNFMITPQGLEDQMLGIVVAKERPELEEKKQTLIVESAKNKKQLKEIEDKILEVLSSSEGNILEDETAVQVLSSSKILSEEITEKQVIASATEQEIDTARSGYKPVAEYSSILFFCLSDLANIEPMYQYSLTWFINLFISSIEQSVKSDDLTTRLGNLNDHFLKNVYRNVCRSLFEKDKLLFSVMLTISIYKFKGEIDDAVWRFLLTGGVGMGNPHPNPYPDWLTDKAWQELVYASELPNLQNLAFPLNPDFKDLYDSPEPHLHEFPDKWRYLGGLDRLVVLRCIRPDKVVSAMQNFVIEKLGQYFVEPPTFDLAACFADSACFTPLIFVLSPGADPMASLLKLASEHGFSGEKAPQAISLGQGQGPIAEQMIDDALIMGTWVILQNCHLATSWMPTLEKICEEQVVPDRPHPMFRMWLTSYPSDTFPVAILQNGIKMTNEPPKGLRANLLRSYLNDPITNNDFYEGCNKPADWFRLLFSLCFFHANVQERRKFGPLGWNIPYEFNDSDLHISMRQIKMFLDDYEVTPFDALRYLIGECNYGGRVTDDHDRRLLNAILSMYINNSVTEQEKYSIAEGGEYFVPSCSGQEDFLNYIRSLPMLAKPDVFGLHDNADITKDQQETQNLFTNILLTLPAQSSSGAVSAEESVCNLAKTILDQLPPQFDLLAVNEKFPILYEDSMNTCLRQEVIRYNILTEVVKSTLENLMKAVKGLVVMNGELEEVFSCLNIGKVPASWLNTSYPSLKPLGSYIADLVQRLEGFYTWVNTGLAPVVFWISGFYFTQSFLTAASQNYARKYKIPIDLLGFQFEVIKETESEVEKPEDGVLVNGLFLEGCRWSQEEGVLAESLSKVLYSKLPVLWLKPGKRADFMEGSTYTCPIYKTSARRGTLSTTGHSTNYVMSVELQTNLPAIHWITRGVALLCQLDD